MSETILNWGIAACGLISQDFCTALRATKMPNHALKACAARSLERAEKFAQKFEIPSFYGSYDELFADKNVNIVYIGTTNNTHKEVCLKAINAGKHVLCEKPMSLNKQDQEEVFKAAKEKGIFFMEALWTRFFSIVKKFKEQITNGSIGDIRFIISNFMVPIKSVERLNMRELGGGGLLDIGIYPIQMICYLMDHEKPLKISCSGHLMPSGCDESASITLLYKNNRMAVINMSTTCVQNARTSVMGDKGMIEIPDFSWCPVEFIKADRTTHKEPLPGCPPTNFTNSVGLSYEAEACREAISQGWKEHPVVAHDNSRLVNEIILESMKQLGCSF
ncbi:trans-1-2-dihydrobenzene-1-2-diol dehydrogenase-like [Brachionus plicatilis]|uniref:Trans-1,2-dihydrobenzene-1,2-diol dehydrogenase n=1 Tax=Brachionus plicatilis TaxID=10195 RepID=A0A3M7SAJ4_BRAPC|nr:trans-1-2-dihydrobenzene-1-2-diol dehydrogenase-like [Brachionus plicatilis]